jgi:ribosomal protein S18 acetylase RimI-like enzyme
MLSTAENPCSSDATSEAFDCAFRRRTTQLTIRPETAADREFLIHLFVQCSPLRERFPHLLLRQQAETQMASHRAANPQAMTRIVGNADQPIGRIAIDWDCDGVSHGVDIAVLPQYRRTGAALHMLRAWLDVADRLGRACRLEVLRDNPAKRLYARLGFRSCAEDDPQSPVMIMQRQAAQRESKPGL